MYDSHGIFLFPSLFEGFGKAPLEAMARGMCVIASNTGGMRDVIDSFDNAVLFEPGDRSGCIDVLKTLQAKPEMIESIAYRARETAIQYTWEAVAQKPVEFYQRLIERKRAGK